MSVSWLGSTCGITVFTNKNTEIDITCKIPLVNTKAKAVAGDFKPKVHFAGIGYAITSALTATTINPTLNILTNIPSSKNGGTLITIPGNNFGKSLTDSSGTKVLVGTKDCPIMKLSSTEIKCITPTDAVDSKIKVTVSGKSVEDATHLKPADGP